MRIVAVTTKLNFITSGASVVELDLKLRTLQSFGHEITLITTHSAINKITEPRPYKVIEKNFRAGRLLPIQWKTFWLLREYQNKADVFLVDGQVFLYGAGLYRTLLGSVPVFAHFNRELGGWKESTFSLFRSYQEGMLEKIKRLIRNSLERVFLIPLANRIDYYSFTNPFLEQTYRNFGLHTKNKYFVAGDAFDWRSFIDEYDVTEESYKSRNRNGGVLTIYYSSRMAPGKGFDLLLEAFSKIKKRENLRLVLGGSGPEESDIKEMVKRLGIDAQVQFTGWAPKIDHYRRLKEDADIFVQPMQSGLDKTSYILLEAMAFGVPAVLPRGGGLEWDAKDSAVYFLPGDTDDLARVISDLTNDTEKRARLSENCYKRLREDEMDYRFQTKRLESVLNNLVG